VALMQSATLTEAAFTARRKADWDELEAIVHRAQGRSGRTLAPADVARVPPLYLDVCADLSRAQAARYAAPLVDYLQGLTAAAHAILYGAHARGRWLGGARPRLNFTGDAFASTTGDAFASTTGDAFASTQVALEAFPRAVRRHAVAMLVSMALFFVPLAGAFLATLADPAFAVRVAPESMLQPLLHAYRHGFDDGRGAGLDAAMAGFYVYNNVGIALRCFATGLAFGLGSAFYLVENGLVTGAVLGYVAAHGAGDNIFTFVVSHGSLELGAIVLAGGAGLALGWSMIAPGDRSRVAALRATARSVAVVVFGAAVMLFMAAAVEGFWSASSAPSAVKRGVGALLFVSLVVYVTLAGRGSAQAEAFERAEAEPWT
jgi:uncharacterized membrane protein SpoIIM required for sporulation